MVVGITKRLFRKYDDSGPVLHVTEIEYKGVLGLNSEDVSFDLNGEVPKLYIKGQEAGVVSMTNHYVTSHAWGKGTNVVTFIYVTNDDPKQKVLSIDRITGEVMNQ